ncbi:V-type proton ATPase subunit G [Wickerhamiella sorbophila]|uniref:V-type proton ATPase subunit G n=1 Tax=Wickerhamiella sorbophila TaxID=45607 RepID=A0A2T0FDX9_9ASCO|nr:V-type proton ATPase subunit G [Wickerhamiella sorbophila]PRT53170.1 V-type proton ATPase subunit G [Wickerhamiella sorbophila]
MSASSSPGIQTLLAAEQKAQDIVQKARQYRSERLKASKADALKEVEEYKQKKEAEFASSSTNEQVSANQLNEDAEKAAQAQIEAVQKQGAASKDKVIKMLVERVTAPNTIKA